jgi:pseudaminic acid synthase
MRPRPVEIAGRAVGPDEPPYVIAEISGNHNGDPERAIALVDAARAAGADAVKLQTYTADTITLDHDGPGFLIPDGLWAGRRLHDLYREAATPWEWHGALFAHARATGITMFSTPFDATAVDLLEDLGAPAYKIASLEIVDLPLVRRAAETGKPLVISTGGATGDEIAEAVETAHDAGGGGVVLLHCVSAYPAPLSDANLATIPALAARFGCPVGFSDHTLGTTAAVTAVALGAVAVEKHVTIRRADGGPDAAFSLEPDELAALVDAARDAHAAIGEATIGRRPSEAANLVFRRSLYVVADVRAGETLTAANVRSIRPGYGLPPKLLPEVIGRPAAVDLPRGTPLRAEHLAG